MEKKKYSFSLALHQRNGSLYKRSKSNQNSNTSLIRIKSGGTTGVVSAKFVKNRGNTRPTSTKLRNMKKDGNHEMIKGMDALVTPSCLVIGLAISESRKTKYVVKWALDKVVPDDMLFFKRFFILPKSPESQHQVDFRQTYKPSRPLWKMGFFALS